MATYQELRLGQRNDEDVALAICQEDAVTPLDLTTATAIELYLKPNAQTDDADPDVITLTLADGDITLTDPAAGLCTAAIPATDLATAGTRWWRLDATVDGHRKTALYGVLTVVDT